MKYTFTAYDYDEDRSVTVEFSAEHIDSVLDGFTNFLRGVGFVVESNEEVIISHPVEGLDPAKVL